MTTDGSSALAPAPLPAGVRRASDLAAPHRAVLGDLRAVIDGPGLRCGGIYSVASSISLALAMMVEHSRSGQWSAVVGVPTLGTQAAASLGIDLDRLALVPDPGERWLEVLTVLSDAVGLIVVQPPRPPAPAQLHRLTARLRSSGTTLIVHGQVWPGSEQRLTVSDSTWLGLRPDGLGTLSARHALVTAVGKQGPRTARMWLPDQAGQLRRYVEQAPERRRDDQVPSARPMLRAVR